jgi:beta-glucosidase
LRQFFWGASTSSYQVEGGAITDNDWHYFTTNEIIKRRIFKLTTGSILYRDTKQISLGPAYDSAKFWDPRYYERDFNDAARLNMNAIRISLEWSRIQPERNQWNQDAVEHYKKMIISMKEKHLTPVITLNHFTLPLWVLTPPTNFRKRLYQYLLPSPLRDLPLKEPPSDDSFWKSLRGWENPETIKAFTKFVENVVLELKSYVDYWITLNEPVGSIVGGGYLSGLYPPGFFLDGNRAKKVLHNLVEAHVQTYNIISEVDDVDADGDGICKSVGISHLMVAVEPAQPKKLFGLKLMDNVQAAKNFAYFVNDYFLNAIVNGVEDLNYLTNLEIFNQESKQFVVNNDWKNRVDFIGLNYYRRVYVYHNPIIAISSSKFVGGAFANDLSKQLQQSHGLLTDLGWEIYPHGLYDFLVKIKKKWKKPILVTENGIADKNDRYRTSFIVSHIHQIRKAILDGVDVLGYLYWSLIDGYEWHEAYSDDSRFGLFHINIQDQYKKRYPTKAVNLFKFLIKEYCSTDQKFIPELSIEKAMNIYGHFSDDGRKLVKSQY